MISSPNYFSAVCKFQFLSFKRGIVLTDSNNVDRSIFFHLPVNQVVLGNRVSVFIKENFGAIFGCKVDILNVFQQLK